MGTLFNQKPRKLMRIEIREIVDYLKLLSEIERKTEWTLADMLQAHHNLELRRCNDLFIQNGDTFDEQMTGLGNLLREFIDNFNEIHKDSLY